MEGRSCFGKVSKTRILDDDEKDACHSPLGKHACRRRQERLQKGMMIYRSQIRTRPSRTPQQENRERWHEKGGRPCGLVGSDRQKDRRCVDDDDVSLPAHDGSRARYGYGSVFSCSN